MLFASQRYVSQHQKDWQLEKIKIFSSLVIEISFWTFHLDAASVNNFTASERYERSKKISQLLKNKTFLFSPTDHLFGAEIHIPEMQKALKISPLVSIQLNCILVVDSCFKTLI
jgi:hypothetical protein